MTVSHQLSFLSCWPFFFKKVVFYREKDTGLSEERSQSAVMPSVESDQCKEGRLLPSTIVIHALCGTESHPLKLFTLKVEDKIILLLTAYLSIPVFTVC